MRAIAPFKLVSMLHVREQVLFSLGEFRQNTSSFLLRHGLARRIRQLASNWVVHSSITFTRTQLR